MGNSVEDPQKGKIELPHDPLDMIQSYRMIHWIWSRTTAWSSNLGNISKGNENINEKRYLQPHFQSSIMITTTIETTIDGWVIEKLCYLCTVEYSSAIKMRFCHLRQHGWTFRVLAKSNRERQILYDLIYLWNLKQQQQKETQEKRSALRLSEVEKREIGGGVKITSLQF